MPGADYEAILAELAKYGASLVPRRPRAWPASKRSTASSSARCARRSSPTSTACSPSTPAPRTPATWCRELGDGVDEQDLVELGEHRCYARLSAAASGCRCSRCELDPPPASDAAMADRLAAASAARYGRDADAVEQDVQAAMARIQLSHRGVLAASQAGHEGAAS